MAYNAPYLIAEVGCNHKGDMECAHEIIKTAAAYCAVDAVKFQKRCNNELLTAEQYNLPHPTPYHSYGETYGEHRDFLEFTVEQHSQLKIWCEEAGLTYGSSVWDLTSAKEIAALNPLFIKIPSASNNHYELMEWLLEHYGGEIHVSLGMTTRKEEEKLIDMFNKQHRLRDLVIYACTSGYPVDFEDICLLEIKRLAREYGGDVRHIGFSGHHHGIAVDIAAYTLGATVLERHITLDRTWKGTDHAASLEPDGMRRLKRDLLAVEKSLRYKDNDILPVEWQQRQKLKFVKS